MGSLALPEGASRLTARPTDLLDEQSGWIELGSQTTTATAEAFWHVIRVFTREQHWNRTIYSVTVTAEEKVSASEGVQSDRTYVRYAPKPGERLHVLRTLSRKTPAPIGGGEDGKGLTYSAEEWASQFVTEGVGGTALHVAAFGLVIPGVVRGPDNPRALRYWPFQYPKVRCYRFTYEEHEQGQGLLRYAVIPLGEDAHSPREFETLKRHSAKSAQKMLTVLRKRAEWYDPARGGSAYVKRVVHDNLLTEAEYRAKYDMMKVKYNFWVDRWTECTDPVKFVYEEMSIAAYLLALWEKERIEEGLERNQTFIDCGCGNGFLVYLLISEGHEGIGVDLQKRDIWSQYPARVTASLRHEEMDPTTYDCSQYDWILGNHSDELSPWLPVMASRSQRAKHERPACVPGGGTSAGERGERELSRAYPRFFVLPCCFFDFDGKKVSFGRTRRTLGVRATAGTGKYEQYCSWIAQISKAFGFTVEYENLRIPSTKYVSLLGRFIEHEERTSPKVIREMTSLLLLDARLSRA